MAIQIVPLRNIGAEIQGLDVKRLSDPDTRAQLYQAWMDYGVLLFRGIGKNPDIHREVTRVFGPLEETEEVLTELRVPDEKAVIAVSKGGKPAMPSYRINGKTVTGIVFWHQDTIFTPTICRGGILRMIEPAKIDGDTGWIDLFQVYDSLSEDMRKRIDKLEVRHRLRCDLSGIPFGLDPSTRELSQEEVPYERIPMPDLPDAVQPLVLTHPETGRKALAISPQSIVCVLGMDRKESDKLLSMLVAHTLREEFMFVHHWEKNDMVLWDNRRMLHCGLGYPPGENRVAHRTTLAGGMHTGRIYEGVD